ncbi:hypothetical protein IC582_020291 [Cucumis melo]
MSSDNYNIDSNDHSDESDVEYELDQLVKLGCGVVVYHFVMHVCKEPCRKSSHTGYKFVMEILNSHEDRCHQQFRMEKHIFQKLLVVLEQQYNFTKAKRMPLEEALAMFLITLGHGFSNRMVQERFQHSGETVSRWFNIVLDVICHMVVDVVAPKGRHIPYIGRKSITTQNIMAVCDFNMCFTFVWAGWEGVAHDARIFVEALRRPHLGFPHPPKDSDYPQTKGYLGPYRGERYHLADFRRGSQPRGMKEEVFNRRHSSLRCTIERTFGVWKNRWRIVRQMHNFPFDKQLKIVVASMALHNFIRVHSKIDFEFKPYDDDEMLLPSIDEINYEEVNEEHRGSVREMEMNEERDRVAQLLMSS